MTCVVSCEEQTPVWYYNVRNLLAKALVQKNGEGARKAGRTSNLDASLNLREGEREGRLAGSVLDTCGVRQVHQGVREPWSLGQLPEEEESCLSFLAICKHWLKEFHRKCHLRANRGSDLSTQSQGPGSVTLPQAEG